MLAQLFTFTSLEKKHKLLCSAFCLADGLSHEAARVNENNRAGNLVDIELE